MNIFERRNIIHGMRELIFRLVICPICVQVNNIFSGLPIYYSLSALLVAVTFALGFLTRHVSVKMILQTRNSEN